MNKQLKNYTHRLQTRVRNQRTQLLEHLHKKLNKSATQAIQRQLSWKYQLLTIKDINPRLDIELPIPIGTCPADCSHKTHFINSILLLIHFPQHTEVDTPAPQPKTKSIVSKRTSEIDGLELEDLIYSLLLSQLPINLKVDKQLGYTQQPQSSKKQSSKKQSSSPIQNTIQNTIDMDKINKRLDEIDKLLEQILRDNKPIANKNNQAHRSEKRRTK